MGLLRPMGELRERLRRHLAASEGLPQRATPDAPPMPGGPRELLQRRAARARPTPSAAPCAPPHSVLRSAGLPSRLDTLDTPFGTAFVRSALHDVSPAAMAAIASGGAPLSWFARDPRLVALDPQSTVYLDIETTSLSGGAGVLIFLVGLATADSAGRVTLRQVFLSDPSSERSLLAAVAIELAAARGVVTFFGKSFDRHRLEARFRMHGLDSTFPREVHADLCHIARARFGWGLVNTRLRTVEESILAIRRKGDLPGALAPQAYFDYLAGRPHGLEGVFEHNARDVLSLVELHAACAAPLEGARPEERLAAAKGAFAIGDLDAARVLLESLRLEVSRGPVRERVLRELVRIHAARGDRAARRGCIEELARTGCPLALLELAALDVRVSGDRGRACLLVREAVSRASLQPVVALRERVLRRAERLLRRIGAVAP